MVQGDEMETVLHVLLEFLVWSCLATTLIIFYNFTFNSEKHKKRCLDYDGCSGCRCEYYLCRKVFVGWSCVAAVVFLILGHIFIYQLI